LSESSAPWRARSSTALVSRSGTTPLASGFCSHCQPPASPALAQPFAMSLVAGRDRPRGVGLPELMQPVRADGLHVGYGPGDARQPRRGESNSVFPASLSRNAAVETSPASLTWAASGEAAKVPSRRSWLTMRPRGSRRRCPSGQGGRDARVAQMQSAVAQSYGGSPNFRRIAAMSAHVGRPDSLPRYWILCAAAARANRRCSSQDWSGLDK
jgi:hypothetical protein